MQLVIYQETVETFFTPALPLTLETPSIDHNHINNVNVAHMP